MSTQYDFITKIECFAQCQRLHTIAQECASVLVIDSNGSQADAKSLLSLMSLDYNRKVRIIVTSPEELFAVQNALHLK